LEVITAKASSQRHVLRLHWVVCTGLNTLLGYGLQHPRLTRSGDDYGLHTWHINKKRKGITLVAMHGAIAEKTKPKMGVNLHCSSDEKNAEIDTCWQSMAKGIHQSYSHWLSSKP
jgi:hypothetical protein